MYIQYDFIMFESFENLNQLHFLNISESRNDPYC